MSSGNGLKITWTFLWQLLSLLYISLYLQIPSYKNFLGRIEESKSNQFKMYGKIEKLNGKEVAITEIPVGVWTQTYKETVLEAMLDDKQIKYKILSQTT